jgi:hypothetical protein
MAASRLTPCQAKGAQPLTLLRLAKAMPSRIAPVKYARSKTKKMRWGQNPGSACARLHSRGACTAASNGASARVWQVWDQVRELIRFELTQQSQDLLYLGGELSRLT